MKGLICVLLMFSFTVSQATDASDYTSQGMSAYSKGDYASAIESFKMAFALRPENSAIAYNISCSYALQGEKDSAFVWLEKALELGMYFFSDDEDLSSLRAEPRYKELEAEGARRIAELGSREWKPVVTLPETHRAGSKYPVVIGLHGFASNPEDFSKVLSAAVTGKGYILCCPYGPDIRGLTAFGWGDCADAQERILAAVEYLKENYEIDTTRVILLGYSQGGRMAFCTGLRNGDTFSGLIMIAGQACGEAGAYADDPDAKRMSVYMMIGEEDYSVESNRAAERLMKEKGMRVKLVVYPDLGHAFPPDPDAEIGKALDWLEKAAP